MNPAGNGDLAFRAFDRIIAFCVGRPRGISISVLQAGHLVVLACSPGSAPMVVTSSKLWMRFSYFHRCTFRAALTGTLDLASLSDDDWRQIDLDRPASEWPKLGEIAKSLVLQYAKVLDVELTDEPPDYLCGRPSKSQDIRGTELDVEHLCIAILALKGWLLISSARTGTDLSKKQSRYCRVACRYSERTFSMMTQGPRD